MYKKYFFMLCLSMAAISFGSEQDQSKTLFFEITRIVTAVNSVYTEEQLENCIRDRIDANIIKNSYKNACDFMKNDDYIITNFAEFKKNITRLGKSALDNMNNSATLADIYVDLLCLLKSYAPQTPLDDDISMDDAANDPENNDFQDNDIDVDNINN